MESARLNSMMTVTGSKSRRKWLGLYNDLVNSNRKYHHFSIPELMIICVTHGHHSMILTIPEDLPWENNHTSRSKMSTGNDHLLPVGKVHMSIRIYLTLYHLEMLMNHGSYFWRCQIGRNMTIDPVNITSMGEKSNHQLSNLLNVFIHKLVVTFRIPLTKILIKIFRNEFGGSMDLLQAFVNACCDGS
jgi:hypothetical protein